MKFVCAAGICVKIISGSEWVQLKKILVTGAAGFLGSHLCDRLLGQGHWVTGIDNLLTGHVHNLAQAFHHPRFRFVEQDVRDKLSGEFSQIFHLASPASPIMYQKDPIETAKINFLGTLNVLELAQCCDARVLLASTSEAYGDPKVHPQPESYYGNVNPTGPRACYDEGKRIAETLAFDFQRLHSVDIRVARIFNTYGPRMNVDDGRVISSFIDQAHRNCDITVFGDGSQTRSFCYYADLVKGLDRLMNLQGTVGPINLGNPEEISIRSLAELVIELISSRSQVVRRPLPQDDPLQRCPDITLAKNLLGWSPKTSLREGLRETIAYYELQDSEGKLRSVQAAS